MICFLCRRAIALYAVSRFPQTRNTVSTSFLFLRSFSSPSGSTISSLGLSSTAVTSSEKNNSGRMKKKNLQTSNSPEHADSVLSMLRSYGFAETHIDNLVQKSPSLLTISISILKPKLDFFREIGFSGVETGKMFSSEPQFLGSSVKNRMMPNFELLCPLFGGKDGALKAVKKIPRLLIGNVADTLLPNLEVLRKHGVVGENAVDFLNVKSRLLFRKTEKLEEYIKRLKDMDCDFSVKKHIVALTVLATNSSNTWDRKVSLFKGFGWTEDDFLEAFKRSPNFLEVADKKLKEKLDFFMNKLNYTAAALSAHPILLMLSLEKRIKPRCAVFNLLASNGKTMKLKECQMFMVSDEDFLGTYVMKYRDEIPELMDAFEGKVEFKGFELECYIKPNIETLRTYYVPEDIVMKIVKKSQKVMLVNSIQFKRVIQGLKQMGFDFSTEKFVDALSVLAPMPGLTSRAKLGLYRSLGWSNDDFVTAFRKQPNFVTVQDEKIRKIVHILEDTINWGPEDIATFPSVLLLGLESNIIPRCSVYKLLLSREILKKRKPGSTFFSINDHKFLQTYVEKYQKDVPEVLEVYNGSRGSSKLD